MSRDQILRLRKTGRLEPAGSEHSEEDSKIHSDKKSAHHSAIQRSRIFACLCVARHLNSANDYDESFNTDIYDTTLELLKPHFEQLLIKERPSYTLVERIWSDFIRTGLVHGKTKLASKQLSKNFKSTKDQNYYNNDDKSRQRDSGYGYLLYGLLCCMIPMLIFFLITSAMPTDVGRSRNVQIDLNRVDEINKRFSNLIPSKNLRTIKARLNRMRDEVSILMLLGSAHDKNCDRDPTYCVGHMIANVSQISRYRYIDASDPKLTTQKMTTELCNSLDGKAQNEGGGAVIIDSLNRLPGTEVMNLFQFIDKDEYKKRYGLLLLIVYTDGEEAKINLRNVDLAERVLLKQWSSSVPSDTLTSVISRISGSIVRVH